MPGRNTDVEKIFLAAVHLAQNLKHSLITTDHIFLSLIRCPEMKKALQDAGILYDSLEQEVTQHLTFKAEIPRGTGQPQMTALAEALVRGALTTQADYTIFNLLKDLSNASDTWAYYYISKYQINPDALIKTINTAPITDSEALEILREHCVNLNQLAKDGKIDPIIGRGEELKKITKVLAKRKKRNVILVGEAGVGKTAIVEGLARNIVNGNVPDHIKSDEVWSLNVGDILAGSRYRGEFEEKVKQIFAALQSLKNCILFISEVHQIKGAGMSSGGGVDFANMIKPVIARGDIKLIADTTWTEYRQQFEKDAALMRRFTMVRVGEPSASETKQILAGLRSYFESFHNGKISDDAIDAAVDYSIRYIPERHLPDKAIDLIDTACAAMKNIGATNWTIDRANIAAEITADRGIKVDDLVKDSDPAEILNIGEKLKEKIFQQDPVMDEITAKLVAWKSGMKDPKKPIGSFMFIGPSGCGKTETAKVLSELLGMNLLHYHMSQYKDKHTLYNLIGAPPGYVGYGNGAAGDGILINDINKNPNSIILFDEMAGKTHQEVCDILLSMADEGEAAGMGGRKADCRNCIIIVSGNLGAKDVDLKKDVGFLPSNSAKEERTKAVDDFFLPELQGRFDMFYFEGLTPINMRRVVVKELRQVEKTRPVLQLRNLKLLPSEELIDHIMGQRKNSRLGARPYKQIVEREIITELGIFLLKNPDIKDTTIKLDWKDGALTILPVTNEPTGNIQTTGNVLSI